MEYKLLKWYPSLPKDWEEGMLVGQGDRWGRTYYSPCNGKYKEYYVNFEQVEQNKEFWEKVIPMFKTEDGVEIFEGDTVCALAVNILEFNEMVFTKQQLEYLIESNRYLFFSKKEMAKSYIEFNKPLFSASDIESLFKKHSRNMIDSSLFMEVRKMVKEKLNGKQ